MSGRRPSVTMSITSCLTLVYNFISEVERACLSLNGRYFGGRIVTAEKYDQDLFDAKDLSG